MAAEIRRKQVTIPPLTTIASGFTADLSFPARVVRSIEVVVPPGPRGEVGWRLGAAGVAVIPVEPLGWVITDDEVIHWPLEGAWDSGSWELFAYNTGRYPHTLQFRFLVDLAGAAPTIGQPIDPATLATVVSDSGAAGNGSLAAAPPLALPPPDLTAPAPPPPAPIAPVTTPAPSSGDQAAPGPVVVTSSVADWYQQILGRPADPAGVAFWLALSRDHGGPLDFPALVVRFAGTRGGPGRRPGGARRLHGGAVLGPAREGRRRV